MREAVDSGQLTVDSGAGPLSPEMLDRLAAVAWRAIPMRVSYAELPAGCKANWRRVAAAVLEAAPAARAGTLGEDVVDAVSSGAGVLPKYRIANGVIPLEVLGDDCTVQISGTFDGKVDHLVVGMEWVPELIAALVGCMDGQRRRLMRLLDLAGMVEEEEAVDSGQLTVDSEEQGAQAGVDGVDGVDQLGPGAPVDLCNWVVVLCSRCDRQFGLFPGWAGVRPICPYCGSPDLQEAGS